MESHLIPGTILNGRYRINKTIGQGGFGITYLAEHLELGIQVCIKELFISGMCSRQVGNTVHSHNVKDLSFEDFVERFLNEARELARFNHSGIVRVTDMFRENGTAYFVMDYVEGKTLKQLVAEKGPYPFEKARPLILQLLDAVETVHQRGMLHRDIKPDNILVTDDGRVVLIDFGSARSFGGGHTMTQTAILTPGYAPVEQYSEKARRGPFTDIYALGATLYFLLTGKKPIPVTDRTLESLPAPHKINPAIHPTVSTAIMLALNIKPEDRFQQVDELRIALQVDLKSNVVPKKRTPVRKEKSALSPEPTVKSLTEAHNQSNKAAWIIVSLMIIGGLFYAFFPIENQTIPAVKIGDQTWMTENLSVDRFRNGDPIPEAKSSSEWVQACENRKPVWCYYEFNYLSKKNVGKIYNLYAIVDSRGLAPVGWHVPLDAEWAKLVENLGGMEIAGYRMKATQGEDKDKQHGFSAVRSGYVNDSGRFRAGLVGAYWWSYPVILSRFVSIRYLDFASNRAERSLVDRSRSLGFAVRCIKD